MFETAVHNLFFETREKQQEKTLWNARHARDVDFYRQGTLAPEEKKAPKMQSVQDFLKAKIDTEYYNLIVKGLHERERLNLSLADADQLETLSTKNE